MAGVAATAAHSVPVYRNQKEEEEDSTNNDKKKKNKVRRSASRLVVS